MKLYIGIFVGAVLAIALGVGVASFVLPMVRPQTNTFGASRYFVPATNIFGTQAAKVRLDGSFTTTTCFTTADLNTISVSGAYTPSSTNAYLLLHVSGSIDGGRTYFPLPTRVAGTNEIDVFADGGTGMSATSGIPYVIPGDKTSVALTTVTSTFIELENSSYTNLCITPIESVSSNNGTLWMQRAGKAGS